MFKIFIGALFAFFDLNLTNNEMIVNLIPDVVGCLLIYLGIREMKAMSLPDSGNFDMAERLALPSVFYAAVLYVLDLLGITSRNAWITFGTGIIYLMIILCIYYFIVKALVSIENHTNMFMDIAKMNRWWRYMTIFCVLTCVTQLAVVFTVSAQLFMAFYVCSLMAIVCEICFMARLYAANKIIRAYQ